MSLGKVMKTTLYTVLCVAVRLGAVFMAVGIFERIPGLIGFAAGLAHLAQILMIEHGSESGGYPAVVSTTEWHWLIEYALIALAGAALLLGSRGLVTLLHRLRGYPYVSVAADPDASSTQDG